MDEILFCAALLAAAVSCSPSPDSSRDTCGQLDSMPVCASELTSAEMSLSVRIWGAYDDCGDPDSILIEVAELDGLVGEAALSDQVIRIDPSAWDQSAGVGGVVAHELGHFAGLGHGPDPCALMAESAPPSGCGTVSVGSCEYTLSPVRTPAHL